MDLLKYVSKRQIRTIKNISSNEMRSLNLCSKKKILLASLFTGLVGGDRFLLGHCKRGILKVTLFLALFIAIVTTVGIITGRVMEVTSQMHGPISVTWEDNVRIAGESIVNTLYGLLIAAGCYIVFVIVDAVLCYRYCIRENYRKILLATKDKNGYGV